MNKEMKVNEKKMEKLYKAFNNKVYVFSALCNDYDQITDNKKIKFLNILLIRTNGIIYFPRINL